MMFNPIKLITNKIEEAKKSFMLNYINMDSLFEKQYSLIFDINKYNNIISENIILLEIMIKELDIFSSKIFKGELLLDDYINEGCDFLIAHCHLHEKEKDKELGLCLMYYINMLKKDYINTAMNTIKKQKECTIELLDIYKKCT